jgi:hypothetical protein
MNAPASERYLRGQRRGPKVSRRFGRLVLRRAMLLLGLVGLAGLGIWAATLAGRAPELAVNRVWVEGNERLSEGEILELLELDGRPNILTLDLDTVRQRLLRSAWVRDVELRRVLPATLTLEIVERRPVAIASLDELYLLADDGTILDQLSPQYDVSKLVLARGLRDEKGLSSERAALAGRLSGALMEDPRLSLLVSEIDVSGGRRSIVVRLRKPAITLLVEEQTMIDRMNEILPLLNGVLDLYPHLTVVDLRFHKRIYLRFNELTPDETYTKRYTSAEFASGGASF